MGKRRTLNKAWTYLRSDVTKVGKLGKIAFCVRVKFIIDVKMHEARL